MAVSDVNIIHPRLLLSIIKRLISQVCRFTWDTSLGDALCAPTMGHYRSDSSPHPWKRQTSRILDVALTRIRLGPHKLTQQLEGDDIREAENGDGIFAGLSIVDKWNSETKSVLKFYLMEYDRNVSETIEHFLLQCPRFHSHRVVLRSQLLTLKSPPLTCPSCWRRLASRQVAACSVVVLFTFGHTTLTVHLHRLRQSPDPHCLWCRNVSETIEHFLLQCTRFHSHRVVLRSQLLTLNVATCDLPNLLAEAGVHPSRQHAVIRLTCAFLRKTYRACDSIIGHHQGS
ncbi:hypothetical protein GWK47_032942 [Chionoecetes opilio]|uniref:Reverse transcriptase zinc-binding domain-containing protein n=1 Tax=Chionoecetes opilio TaxID=41210 RepID=A0A8J4YJF9_CHIOP|nr:hypothetical protein GWK47_032942 [Chionoecetes opilio]